MGIDLKDWKEYCVRDIFSIRNGKGITTDEITEHKGTLEAVQSGEDMFGTIGYIDWNYCAKMNYTMTNKPCLVVARSGTSGYVSYHDSGCVVGDSAKLILLKDEKNADTLVYLFLQTLLNANRYKFSFGNKVTTEKYESLVLRLPSAPSGEPDWAYMRKFMFRYYNAPLEIVIKSYLKSVPLELYDSEKLFADFRSFLNGSTSDEK